MGQNFAFSMVKSTPARKKSTPPPVVWLEQISAMVAGLRGGSKRHVTHIAQETWLHSTQKSIGNFFGNYNKFNSV